MRKEECSSCGKEFDIRDLYESLKSDDFTCKKCHKKQVEAGEVEEEVEVYADISEIPLGEVQPDDEESFYEGDDWD